MRASIFATLLAVLSLLIATVIFAPHIGLGENEDFILYEYLSVSRSEAFFWLRVFLVICCTVQLLITQGSFAIIKQNWTSFARPARLVKLRTSRTLFMRN